MITPHLEKLIFEGKAFFKTFVAGGAKSTLNIDQDRFIIITDITYLPNQADTFGFQYINTQVSIYGEKGFNHYIFRNSNSSYVPVYDGATIQQRESYDTLNPVTINTYLLHTTQVGFSFLSRGGTGVPTYGVASVDNPGYLPPLDYGKDGDPGAITIPLDMTNGGILNQLTNRQGYALSIGSNVTQQVQFPASAAAIPFVEGNPHFPVLNVNYVEILGQPTNIGF